MLPLLLRNNNDARPPPPATTSVTRSIQQQKQQQQQQIIVRSRDLTTTKFNPINNNNAPMQNIVLLNRHYFSSSSSSSNSSALLDSCAGAGAGSGAGSGGTVPRNSNDNDNDNDDDNDDDQKNNYLQSLYQTWVNEGTVQSDVHQMEALGELDRLRNQLLLLLQSSSSTQQQQQHDVSQQTTTTQHPTASNFLMSLFGGFKEDDAIHKKVDSAMMMMTSSSSPSSFVKGVYLHGGVGCGKTFCMNMFYDSLEDTEFRHDRQKVHFHKFMLGVHKKMHEAKMVEGIEGDVLPRVMEQTIEAGRIICFDEFQVTDVADALILQRLFTGLMERGAVVVATSNRPPQDLYLGGLQRDRFLPFIDLLEERHNVISMWESEMDYRLIQAVHKAHGVYFVSSSSSDDNNGNGNDNDSDKNSKQQQQQDFESIFLELTKGAPIVFTSVVTAQGRRVPIRRAAVDSKVARFHFDELCRTPMGAADYLAIGESFSTVFLEGVPAALEYKDVNVVRRFIVLIDALYECGVKLIVHAATRPEGIFEVDFENRNCDEAFAFDRTRSRLEEMGSEAYLSRQWLGSSRS